MAETVALAVLENLVHLTKEDFPTGYIVVAAVVPTTARLGVPAGAAHVVAAVTPITASVTVPAGAATRWQGRPSRLHDRLRYTRTGDNHWRIDRLSP